MGSSFSFFKILMKMKKFVFVWIALISIIFSLSSCKEKIKDVEGVVTSVDINGDTIRSMKVFNGEDTLIFTVKDAQYDNGVMLANDNVKVHYLSGNGDTLRAVLVYVKPRPSKVIELKPDRTKPLLTR